MNLADSPTRGTVVAAITSDFGAVGPRPQDSTTNLSAPRQAVPTPAYRHRPEDYAWRGAFWRLNRK